jgi:two-component system, chemotaxis family, CheB/CheR fusion protein
MVGVVGGIGQHGSRSILGQQGGGLRRIAALAGGEDDPCRAAKPADRQVDLGAQAAAGSANGLILALSCPCRMLMGAHDRAVEDQVLEVRVIGHGGEDAVPDEASKEELQSVNEELRTVNLELSGKVEDLDRANADLLSLFESTQVATVFLDRHLVIRSFRPAVTSLFNLLPGDVGRPLTDFNSRLEGVDIRAESRRVLDSREGRERRVATSDGTTHYLMRLLPYRIADGTVGGVVATFLDVTRVVEGEVLGTLVAELNHRVRNMLQVVQAVAAHALRRSHSLDEFGRVFRGRIGALARAHELVSVGGWGDVPLHDLILKELGAYAEGGGRLLMEGPPLRLTPRAALALGMVLHELATNAAKHGALSAPAGRVTVAWEKEESADGSTRLMLRWTERGGPPVGEAPERRGFGSELIERQLRHDLGGEIETAYEPAGLRATLTLPANVVAHHRSDRGGAGTGRNHAPDPQ